jgi:hypothetical protein
MLWNDNLSTGDETRLAALSCTDFEGDVTKYGAKIDALIDDISNRKPFRDNHPHRLLRRSAIVTDLYRHLEKNGCRVVFSEVERQFSIPYGGPARPRVSHYTYPYGIFARIPDINHAIEERKLDGIIHYVQSICFRGIEDIALRKSIGVPVLTLQGDLPTKVTETMEIRNEAFLDMLVRRKERG